MHFKIIAIAKTLYKRTPSDGLCPLQSHSGDSIMEIAKCGPARTTDAYTAWACTCTDVISLGTRLMV